MKISVENFSVDIGHYRVNKGESTVQLFFSIPWGKILDSFTALFITPQSLELKNQLTFAFFPAVSHLSLMGLLGNRMLLKWVQKVKVCDL